MGISDWSSDVCSSDLDNTSTNSADHGFFSKERITAPPGFNRWMIPPAALAVHLCIGQAYAFSVFNNPMTKLLGITQSAPNDWDLPTLGWIFSLAIFLDRKSVV